MARKDAVSDWDVTPNSNDNVGGVNIAENCAAANINNAIRTVMAQIKTYTLTAEPGAIYTTKSANYTAVLTDENTFFRFTNNATLNLTAAATLTNGWHCWIMADGGDLTIDPNGAETVNGAATLALSDGYSALLICSGTTFYAVTVASQAVVAEKLDELQPYINVASAATTDVGAIASQNVTITGTVTITSFGTAAAGTVRNILFSNVLTLTHNGTSLILPYAANIVTSSRAAVRAISLGSGNWRVTDYQPASEFSPTLTAGTGLTSTGSLASGAMTIDLDIYTGSSASATSFPIGHVVLLYVGDNIARNGAVTPAIADDDTSLYVTSSYPSAGASLSGTWRVRGGSGTANNDYYTAVRVA